MKEKNDWIIYLINISCKNIRCLYSFTKNSNDPKANVYYIYVRGLISFASTVLFLFTLDISGQNQFCVVAWYLSSIILHLEHTDAYSPHPVHIKMEEFSDVQCKQHAVIEFLTAEKVRPIEIHRRMQAVYGDQFVDVSAVRRWVRRLKR